MSLDTFPWPLRALDSAAPVWNGVGFVCAGETCRVLAYETSVSNWSDDLTSFHEAEAGVDHPIDIASRRWAIKCMSKLQKDAPILLDIGCSSGFLLEELQKAMPRASLIGADYLRGPLERLGQRISTIPFLQFDLRKCPLPDCCVDGVTCLNVLEHIDDDAAAMREIYRILTRGGIAEIEVPAGPDLFDIYDEHLLHHRRYRLLQISALAKEVGFHVEKATHLGCFVFPAFWLVKKKNRRKLSLPAAAKEALVANQIRSTRSSRFLAGLMKIETYLGKYVSYPMGIRCVMALRKT